MRANLLLLLLLVAGGVSAAPRSFVIADVLVNGLAQRPVMIAITTDGEIFGRRQDVTGWNIDVGNAPAENLQNVDHVRLTALPGINARFDGVTLTIDAAGSAFQGTYIDMQKKSALSIDGGKGGYINYDLSSFASRGQRTISGASVEAVVYADNLSFASSGLFSNARPGREFVRYESNLR